MVKFTTASYEELKSELQDIAIQSENMLQRAQRSFQSIQNCIQQLKDFILQYNFKDKEEEVLFFKQIKPQYLRDLHYYNEIFYFEAKRPVSSKDELVVYFNRGLERIRLFFERNQDLYNYHRMGKMDQDSQYYIRNVNSQDDPSTYMIDFDSRFCTVHSYKLSRILAFEQFKQYLLSEMEALDQESKVKAAGEGFQLTWTDSKVALIELLYAIHSRGAINNGKLDIKQLFTVVEQLLNIDLGNYYAVFQQNIRIRKKNRTAYLEQLIEYLERRMDDADENPKNYF